jgi:diguanylate cyclase (GGDEF)-like protein
MLWSGLTSAGLLEPVDRLAYDWHLRWQAPTPGLPQVVIVAFDDASLAEVPWPWGRDVQAQLLDRLQGAQAVLLDVLLADPGERYEDDLRLAASLRRHGHAYLAVAADPAGGQQPVMPDSTFQGSARGYGSIRVDADDDAIVRRTRLHFPLAPAAAHQATGSDGIALMALQIARQIRPDLPVPASGVILPNFRRHPHAFEQVAAIDVLKGLVPPAHFRNRIVLVGATATGLNDIHKLPVGLRFGIDYQAQVITSLVRGDWRQPLLPWVVAVLTGLAVTASLIVWTTRPAGIAALALVGGTGVIMAGDALAWHHFRTWLPCGPMLLASLLSLLLSGLGRQLHLARRLHREVGGLVLAYRQHGGHATGHQAAGLPQRQSVGEQIESLVHIANAFQEEWRFLRDLIETNHDPVLVIDPSWRVTFCNRAGIELFGPDAIGKQLQPLLATLLDADDQARVTALCQAVHAGRPEEVPPLVQHGHRTLEPSFLPLNGGRGTLCLFTDITAMHLRANTDGLTGLWNRRYFDERLASELARYRRHGDEHPVGLILLDIDHFKRVNDTYGHQVGDQVIRMVADLLRETLRTTDLPVRYGGEEIAILLTHADLAGAMILAERLRAGIAELAPTDAEGRTFRISASFGVALSEPDDTPQSLIGQADQALYQSKANGRNRVTARATAP